MPVVSKKSLQGGERAIICGILAEMAAPELTDQTKHRLSRELGEHIRGFKSFDDFGKTYALTIVQSIEDDTLWVKIYIPTTFTVGKAIDPLNRDSKGVFVKFLVQSSQTKPGEKLEGIPVLSKEDANAVFEDIVADVKKKAEEKYPELKNS